MLETPAKLRIISGSLLPAPLSSRAPTRDLILSFGYILFDFETNTGALCEKSILILPPPMLFRGSSILSREIFNNQKNRFI